MIPNYKPHYTQPPQLAASTAWRPKMLSLGSYCAMPGMNIGTSLYNYYERLKIKYF